MKTKQSEIGFKMKESVAYIGIVYRDTGAGSSYRPAFLLEKRDAENEVSFFERCVETARMLMARNYADDEIEQVELFTANARHEFNRNDIREYFERCGSKIANVKIY